MISLSIRNNFDIKQRLLSTGLDGFQGSLEIITKYFGTEEDSHKIDLFNYFLYQVVSSSKIDPDLPFKLRIKKVGLRSVIEHIFSHLVDSFSTYYILQTHVTVSAERELHNFITVFVLSILVGIEIGYLPEETEVELYAYLYRQVELIKAPYEQLKPDIKGIEEISKKQARGLRVSSEKNRMVEDLIATYSVTYFNKCISLLEQ